MLDKTAEAVLRPGSGRRALRLDVVKIPAHVSLVKYLNSGWIGHVDDGSVGELAVHHIPVATATAKPSGAGESWRYRLAVVKFGGNAYRLIYVAKNLTKDTDKSFRQLIRSFRKLTERDKTAQPLRPKVVEVMPGETVKSLAARTIFSDHQVGRFRLLNGLEPGAKLKPGKLVKILPVDTTATSSRREQPAPQFVVSGRDLKWLRDDPPGPCAAGSSPLQGERGYPHITRKERTRRYRKGGSRRRSSARRGTRSHSGP